VTKFDSYSVLISVESQLSRSLHMSSPGESRGPATLKRKTLDPGFRRDDEAFGKVLQMRPS